MSSCQAQAGGTNLRQDQPRATPIAIHRGDTEIGARTVAYRPRLDRHATIGEDENF